MGKLILFGQAFNIALWWLSVTDPRFYRPPEPSKPS